MGRTQSPGFGRRRATRLQPRQLFPDDETFRRRLATGDRPVFLYPEHATYAAPFLPKKKASPYSITERKVPELIPVLCSQPAGDVSHKPGGRLPLLSARPAVTLATLKRAATNFAAW